MRHVASARLVRRATGNGLMGFKDDVPLGKEYRVWLPAREQELFNSDHLLAWRCLMVEHVDRPGQWLPVECLDIFPVEGGGPVVDSLEAGDLAGRVTLWRVTGYNRNDPEARIAVYAGSQWDVPNAVYAAIHSVVPLMYTQTEIAAMLAPPHRWTIDELGPDQ